MTTRVFVPRPSRLGHRYAPKSLTMLMSPACAARASRSPEGAFFGSLPSFGALEAHRALAVYGAGHPADEVHQSFSLQVPARRQSRGEERFGTGEGLPRRSNGSSCWRVDVDAALWVAARCTASIHSSSPKGTRAAPIREMREVQPRISPRTLSWNINAMPRAKSPRQVEDSTPTRVLLQHALKPEGSCRLLS